MPAYFWQDRFTDATPSECDNPTVTFAYATTPASLGAGTASSTSDTSTLTASSLPAGSDSVTAAVAGFGSCATASGAPTDLATLDGLTATQTGHRCEKHPDDHVHLDGELDVRTG